MSHKKIGLAPGSLVYTGSAVHEDLNIGLINYSTETVQEAFELTVQETKEKVNDGNVNWINITGLNNEIKIAELGQVFAISNLILEDVLNIHQLPKAEEIDDHLFVTLKMLSLEKDEKRIEKEHVSFILGNGYLISFQEKEGDVFDTIRKRIRAKSGRIRSRGNDYLLYALMDAVIDNYLLVTTELSERIENVEDDLLSNEDENIAKKIMTLKKELTNLRKFIFPLQSAVLDIQRLESDLVAESVAPFFKDLNDHIRQVIEYMQDQREILSGYMDLHISLMSNNMNKIMKVLTIVAAIFIPLTFLAGIYGMNFDYMPELHWKWSYPLLISIMVVLGLSLAIYMKRKKWL